MADKPKTATVQITNTGAGPRYVHTTDGQQVMVRPGQTTDEIEMLAADLADLPAGLTTDAPEADELPADPAQGGEGDGGEGTDEIPADLADKSSNDGLIKRDAMVEIAKAAGVEMDGKETKADLLAKIKAARG